MSTNIFNPGTPELVVENYFRLVKSIAKRIKHRLPAHVDVNDLVQAGVIGLLEASSRYDSSREVMFPTFARSRTTGAILDELRRSDPCSRNDRKQARETEDARCQLRATRRKRFHPSMVSGSSHHPSSVLFYYSKSTSVW